MKRLLSLRPRSRPEPTDETRVVHVDEPEGGEVLDALSSETTRAVFAAVRAEPRTATEVSEAVGTSLQNAKYHLEKLRDADLIEVGDTWYSEQGNEMAVYAPTTESVVVFAGPEETKASLRDHLSRIVGILAVLAVGAVAVDRAVGAWSPTYTSDGTRPFLPVLADPIASAPSPAVVFVMGGVTVLAVLALLSFAASR